MRFLKLDRVKDAFDQKALSRLFERVEAGVNKLAERVEGGEERTRREILAVSRKASSALASAKLNYEIVFEEDASYAYAKLRVSSGWKSVRRVQVRWAYGKDTSTNRAWTTWNDGDSGTNAYSLGLTHNFDYVADASLGSKQYWQAKIELPITHPSIGRRFLTIEMRALNTVGETIALATGSFDSDKLPDVETLNLTAENWDGTQWEVFANGTVDTDTGSVYIIASTTEPADDNSLNLGDFTTGDTDTTSVREFHVSMGMFDPDDVVYAVAAAWSGTSKSGTGPNGATDGIVRALKRDTLVVPPAPGVDGLSDGDIAANLLADAAQRASVALSVTQKAGDEENTITVNGTITYSDGNNTGTITNQDLTPNGAGITYIFYDPDTWADESVADPGSAYYDERLQLHSTLATAAQVTGRRVLVGLMKKATITGKYAFYVLTSDNPVLTAPFIYAASLSAISADLGTITSGDITLTDTNGGSSFRLKIDDGASTITALEFTASTALDGYMVMDTVDAEIFALQVDDAKIVGLGTNSWYGYGYPRWWITGDWEPVTDSAYKLGSSGLRWSHLYADAINGLTWPVGDGTAGYVLATDGAGTVSWTEITKTTVGLGNVENTALSTWAGTTNITTIGNATATRVLVDTGTALAPTIGFSTDTSQDTGWYWLGENNIGLALGGLKVVDYAAGAVSFESDLYPLTNAIYNMGSPSLQWANLYAVWGIFNTGLTVGGNNVYYASGADVAVADGGTNISSYTAGDILYASGTTTLAKLPKGSDGEVLTLASGVPSWAPGGGSGTVTSVSGTGTVSGLTLTGTVTTSGSLTLGGTLSVGASAVTAGSFGSGNFTFTGAVRPNVTNLQDLGSASLYWNNAYINDIFLEEIKAKTSSEISVTGNLVDYIGGLYSLGKSGQNWLKLWVDNITATGSDINMTGLATSDPAVAGRLWNDSGTLKVSAG